MQAGIYQVEREITIWFWSVFFIGFIFIYESIALLVKRVPVALKNELQSELFLVSMIVRASALVSLQ